MRRHNSTIKINQKECRICGKPCVWFSDKMCQQCAKLERIKLQDAEEVEEDLSGLIADADVLVSRWVRYKDADSWGDNRCYTCNQKLSASKLQCGHYISRKNMATRYLLANLRPQCVTCNEVKNGNLAVFGRQLEKQSPGITEWLLEESRQVYKITREELRSIIKEYTEKLAKLKVK